MARFVTAVLMMVPVLGLMTGVRAQLPPLDEVTDPIEDTVDQIEETIDPVEDTVEDTVDEVGGAVDQTAGDVEETVEQTAEGGSGTLGQAGGAASGTGGAVGGAAGAATGTLSGTGGGSGAGAGGSSPGGGQTKRRASRAGEGRARSDGPGDNGGGVRMARVVSATRPASLVPLVYVPLVVRLTNDADGDGQYAEIGSAQRSGEDIPFQLRLQNEGPNELTILGIRDASSHPSGPLEGDVCGHLIGSRLATDQSAVCRFSVEGATPPEGERLVAVAEVDAAETADPNATATVTDTSVIRTEEVGVLGEVVQGVLGTLANTGAWIGLLGAIAVGLATAGVWMIRSGDQKRTISPTWVGSMAPGGASGAPPRTDGGGPSARRRGRGRHTVGSSLAGHSTVRREGLAAGTTRRGN